MVLRGQTEDGRPVHLALPNWFIPSVIALFGVGVSFAGWMAVQIVSNQRLLTSHEERIISVERRSDASVTYREMESITASIVQRMDRIETKLDRVLEAR